MTILLSEIILSGTCYTPLPDGEQKLEKTPGREAGLLIKPSKQQFWGGERSKRLQGR